MSKDDLHMCDLSDAKDIEEMKKRSRNAKWICSECGRVAHDKKHLCEPIELN
ncbi:MAG: hypothetical protein ACFFEF_10450 [Candidatus Thorarchaeota archaeon]